MPDQRIPAIGGDLAPAFDAWKSALDRANWPVAGPNVLVSSTAAGDTLKAALPLEKDLILSGSTSPYTGQQVLPASAGAWTAMPGAISLTPVYEHNAVAGLGGKVVRARLDETGTQWRFRYVRQGTAGCSGVTYTFTVKGCAAALQPGAVVTVTQGGVTIGTCTTNGSGVCSISIPANGTYDFTVGKSGYATQSGSFTITGCVSGSRTVNIGAATGYSCSRDPCCPIDSGPPYPVHNYPTTLYANDGFGLITLTYSGGTWSGCATRSGSGYSCPVPGTLPPPSTISVGVSVSLQCTGTPGSPWSGGLVVMSDCGPATDYPTASSCASLGSAGFISSNFHSITSCSPLAMTFDMLANPISSKVYGTAPFTLTISE